MQSIVISVTVCLFVCPLAYLKNYTSKFHQILPRAVYAVLLAFVHSPPIQMSHKISGVTGRQFPKFLSDMKKSSFMLKQESACDIPIRC